LKYRSQGGKKGNGFPSCSRKQKGLAMNGENLTKIHVIENNKVIRLSATGVEEKKRVENGAILL
jgi:hypothetical protein